MNARIAHILKSPLTSHVGVAAVALGGGVGIGYILWGRAPKFEVLPSVEEEPQLEFDFDTAGLAAKMASRNPTEVAEAKRIVSAEGYIPVLAPETDAVVVNDAVIVETTLVEETETELVEVNVFEESVAGWDWETEVEGRGDESKPYILHRDEFYRNEDGYTQMTLTYYIKDNIVVDERNVPIHNHAKLLGPLKFGHGSGDPVTCLIRNRQAKGEYEVNLNEGSFDVEVLGLDFEQHEADQDLKHSAQRRFRDSD